MKHFVPAALSLAGLLAPHAAIAQDYRCVMVCNPPRVYCVPNGSQLPPLNTMCRTGPNATTPEPALSAPSSSAAATGSACSAQQVFDEATQTYEWEMVCD